MSSQPTNIMILSRLQEQAPGLAKDFLEVENLLDQNDRLIGEVEACNEKAASKSSHHANKAAQDSALKIRELNDNITRITALYKTLSEEAKKISVGLS